MPPPDPAAQTLPAPGGAQPAGAAARRSRRRRILRAYVLLPHAVPVLVVIGGTAGFAVLSAGGLPPPGQFVRLLLAMLGGQLAIGAVNEVVDAELDAATKPWKPIPAGDVSPRGALLVAAGGLVAMVGCGAGFGPAALALLLLGTGAGLAYDLWFKRSPLSWLPYLVALPLLPLWVRTALVGFDARLLLLYPLGGLAVVGVHLAQALPDVAGDRAAGVRNLASLLGERRALLACWAAILSAPVLALAALLLAPSLAERPTAVRVAALIVVALVGLDAVLYAVRPRLGVLACFPCVAVAAALMGLGWVFGVSG
jgi:4-hydroxybenzoate polyprenyltransferase